MLEVEAFAATAAMRVAATELRTVAIVLARLVAELTGPAWSGADADRMHERWDEDVTRRLLAAADRLDTVPYGGPGG